MTLSQSFRLMVEIDGNTLLEEEVPTELKVLLDLDLVTLTSLINTPLKIPPPAALVEGVSLR